ncbi:acyl-CoA-binding protein [Flagellimonas halotolerans]|uniref:Acyl-CoA-binding protein n=1 Tax=Flagellimonas halotolerans TaxID=3112164 RepID=A0ABU6ISG4_9FLAO|nr:MULTISPECIES: acyl-CoA-binding protein [unclassified Allomuricauda]MEC3965959.1 acyl-CoA-binding protein [Muricauda sp. SYSU M86414]MEC4265929.1 acyl-CoA-binding protein [Muricauda sp. SYSU M84420]
MINEDLHKRFNDAVDFVNGYTDPLPADLLLKLYAYFKIANKNFDNPGSRTPLINAFKANALFQAKRISEEEAMEKYVELVEKELKTL